MGVSNVNYEKTFSSSLTSPLLRSFGLLGEVFFSRLDGGNFQFPVGVWVVGHNYSCIAAIVKSVY